MISLYNYRATTITKAFVINAIVISIITVLGIELRRLINIEVYSKNLPNWLQIILTMVGTSLMAFFVFIFMRFCLNFGDGMLATSNYPSFF